MICKDIINKKIIISEDIIDNCINFAQACVKGNADRYARRNQLDINKIIKDIKIGKIGEEIVYQQLVQFYPNLTKPDYTIYGSSQKSWDPDLKDLDSKLRIAVKSQDIESALNFGESWVFQFNNNANYDCDVEVFKEKNPNHYVAFIALNVPKRTAMIRGIIQIEWLHANHLFKDMKKQNLRGNKLAVYFDDLSKYENLCQI